MAAFREVKAGHKDLALTIAPDVEFRTIDIQLLEAQTPERRGRQGDQHARQAQRGTALGIEQLHISQFKRGNHAAGIRRDCADVNRNPHLAGGSLFEPRAQLVDSGHNDPMQRSPGGAKKKPRSHSQTQ